MKKTDEEISKKDWEAYNGLLRKVNKRIEKIVQKREEIEKVLKANFSDLDTKLLNNIGILAKNLRSKRYVTKVEIGTRGSDGGYDNYIVIQGDGLKKKYKNSCHSGHTSNLDFLDYRKLSEKKDAELQEVYDNIKRTNWDRFDMIIKNLRDYKNLKDTFEVENKDYKVSFVVTHSSVAINCKDLKSHEDFDLDDLDEMENNITAKNLQGFYKASDLVSNKLEDIVKYVDGSVKDNKKVLENLEQATKRYRVIEAL